MVNRGGWGNINRRPFIFCETTRWLSIGLMPPVGKSEKEKLCLAETVLSLFPPFFYSPLFFSPFPLIDDRIETWQAWKLRATGDGVVALWMASFHLLKGGTEPSKICVCN